MMSTTPTFTPQLIGRTEKTLNAILERALAGTGLTEPQWVTLTLTLTGGGGGTVDRDQLVDRVTGALHITDAAGQELVAALAAANLVEDPDGEGALVTVTGAGQQLHRRIRGVVKEITDRMWGDLAEGDLAAAARVLSTVLDRANAELAAAR